MELIEKLRKILATEYNIKSDVELLDAIEKQTPLDIGIFVSPCGRKDLHPVKRREE